MPIQQQNPSQAAGGAHAHSNRKLVQVRKEGVSMQCWNGIKQDAENFKAGRQRTRYTVSECVTTDQKSSAVQT